MRDKMKALVQYAPYDNRIEILDIPKAGSEEVILKVGACGICAGDIKAYHGGIRIWGTDENNRYIEAPVVGGHEFFGEIVEIGTGVEGYKLGEAVLVEQIVPCNKCTFCREGKYWLCTESAVYGFKKHINGGFAEYVKLDKNSIIHKVPSDFTPEQAVLVEPIACGMHAVEQAEIKHSDVVVIAGMGAIGTSMVNLAKLCLPKMIIGIDVKPYRLEMGKIFGADYVINPLEEDVVAKIKKLTNNLGCDVYIEASGSPKSVMQGMNALKNRGKYVQMGVFAEEVQADWNIIGDGKELTIKGSHLSALTFGATIRGIEDGSIRTEGLISQRFKLEEWKEAFDMIEKDPNAMKIILVP